MHHLETLLKRFQTHANHPSYPWMYRYVGGKHETHIILSTLIHGNETGPLPAFLWAIEALENGTLQYGGTITCVLGNPEAALQDQRFLESDLNRMFLDTPLNTHESRRAIILRNIFDEADIFIDFHQTILPSTKPFYICPWTDVSAQWARALALTDAGIDATPPTGPATTRCADDYVSLRGKPAITIELGEKGFHTEAETIAQKAIQRAILLADDLAQGGSLSTLAKIQPEITLYQTLHREPYLSDTLLLRPGLINFLPLHKGELLSAPKTPEIRAAIDGCILFPKYPAFNKRGLPLARPKEIFRIVAPLPH
jgi:succinylglutamate desuccinylase